MFVINFILFILYVSVSQCRVPDKVYCVNEECNEPISKAKTLIGYNSADPDLISYPGNTDALIFMKSAGTNADLWYVTVNGKSGFVNSKFLREYKILQKNAQLIVPFEKSLKESIVQPDKVQQPHEVIDGTTIYTTEPAIYETTTEIPTTQSSSADNYEPSTNTESPVNVNILNTYTEEQNLSDKPVNEESQNTPNSDTNNEVKDLEPEANLPQKNTQTYSEPHQSNSENIDLINRVTKSQHPKKLIENGRSQQPGNENSDETIQNISENYDQVPNDSAYIEPLKIVESIMSIENPTNDEGIQKAQLVLTENKQSSEEVLNNDEQSVLQNNPEVSNEKKTLLSEPVISNSDNNIRDSITVLESVKNIEQIVTEEPYNVEKNIFTTNNVNENMQSTESITEVTTADKDQNEPFVDDKLLIQDNINQDNHITSVNPEHQQTATIIDNVYSKYPENTNENVEDSLRMNYGVPDTSKTVSAIFNTESSTIQPEYKPDNLFSDDNLNEKSSEVSQEQVSNDEFNKNQETNNIEDSTNNIYSYSTESTTIEDSSTPTTPEPSHDFSDVTEVPVSRDESSDGILSSIYTTISDIWPTTTELPSNLFNSEDYPSYEKTKVDGEESFSFVKYIMSMYSSILGNDAQTMALFASSGETCFTNEYCDGSTNERNNRLLTFLLTTASSVLLFTLGYYYIDIKRQDGRLIGTINSLQRDLLFTTKECEILKEELATTKNKLAGIEDNSFGMDDMVKSLKEEINELNVQNERLRNSLDANEKLLRVSENTAGELQNTLSDVENTLSELFAERASSEEQIVELNEKIQAFEEELISVSRERDNFQLKYVSAETSLEEARKQTKQLDEINKQLTEAKNTIELQKHEITALKDALRDLKSDSPNNVDVTSLIDHTEIKAKLAKTLEERNTYANKYEVEYKERLRLTEEQKVTQETLLTTSQQAAEAMTRLEVLGKYFQERESELMKELSSKEALWLSKQGESASTIDKIDLLQQEVQRYKEKCDALTLELAEQESTRRTAVSEVEARAHTAWLEARATRREADAARDEAATLRRKLASLSTADGAVSPHHKISSPLDNSENPIIPPPLPPLAFLPPPLLPPLPRPPPLGRLPSPHPPRYNDRRYSPDSRYSPESRYSPGRRYSPETVRYSPESRYSPRQRRTSYSPRSRRRSRERYQDGRGSRSRNLPPDTETEYPSDSPSRDPRRRNRYSRHSGPSSGSGCSSESDK